MNLLSSTEWRFVSDEKSRGLRQTLDNGETALVIENPEYLEGPCWEQSLDSLSPGSLLSLQCRVQTQGECWRRIKPDQWSAGTQMVLEVLGQNGTRLDSAEFTFFPTPDANGRLSANAEMQGALALVVPEGTKGARVRLELSGQGTASFLNLSLTAQDANAGTMNDSLVESLKVTGAIRSLAVERAFRRTLRHHFLPGYNWGKVYQDEVIATHFAEGTGEAISSSSQPAIMAIMLEQLQVEPGMPVLEIGTGTGYNAVLLSHLTGNGDNVWTVDVDAVFCSEARAHLEAAGVSPVHVVCADGWNGWLQGAPYDRILVTASAHDIAPAWVAQLREGGRLVLPWGAPNAAQRAITFRKEGETLVMEAQCFCGFMPLRGAQKWSPPAGGAAMRDWNDWLFPGQPKGDPVRLVAYPRGQAPAPGLDEHLIEGRWFNYVASWA